MTNCNECAWWILVCSKDPNINPPGKKDGNCQSYIKSLLLMTEETEQENVKKEETCWLCKRMKDVGEKCWCCGTK